MNNEKNPPLHLEIAQLNSELDIEEPLDGETLSLPSSKRTHPETELGNEELKQTTARVKLLRSKTSWEEWKADCEADKERQERECEKKMHW